MNALLILSQVLGLVSLGALIWLVVRAANKHVGWAVAVFLLSPIAAIVFAIKHWQAAKHPFVLYMTSSVGAVALAVHVFLAWGGGELLRTSGIVHSGIQDESLAQEDALAFMRANINLIENSGVSEEDQAKLDTMRKFLSMTESGMTVEDQRAFSSEMLDSVDPSTLDEEGRRHLQMLRKQHAPQGAASVAGFDAGDGSEERLEAAEPPRPRVRAAPPRRLRWEYIAIDPSEAAAHVGASVKVIRANGTERAGTLIAASGQALRVERRMYGGKVEFEVSFGDVRTLKVRKQVSESS